MTKTKVKKVPCTACVNLLGRLKSTCRECRGVGYTEVIEFDKNCTGNQPNCDVEYEPSVNGWMCNDCGRSGPC